MGIGRQCASFCVDIFSGNTEVLSEVYYLYILRNGMLFKKGFTLSMTEAEEYYIYFIKRQF